MSDEISDNQEPSMQAGDMGEGTTRRAFVGGAVGLVGVGYLAALGYPIYKYLTYSSEQAAQLGAVNEVTLTDPKVLGLPKGSALAFRFGVSPAILIHHENGEWVAFNSVCTHLGCTVSYQSDKNRIHCACHDGVYDSYTGENVSGPPPKPLTPYKVDVTESSITISRI